MRNKAENQGKHSFLCNLFILKICTHEIVMLIFATDYGVEARNTAHA